MISLDKARRLKELGLAWEPKIGDAYILHGLDGESVLLIDGTNGSGKDESTKSTKSLNRIDPESLTWLPSLSQLLAEISNRYKPAWELYRGDDGYSVLFDNREWGADTPEDAAADALLWILGQEGQQ